MSNALGCEAWLRRFFATWINAYGSSPRFYIILLFLQVTFECEYPIKRDFINNNNYYTRGTMIIVATMDFFKNACRWCCHTAFVEFARFAKLYYYIIIIFLNLLYLYFNLFITYIILKLIIIIQLNAYISDPLYKRGFCWKPPTILKQL